MWTPNSREQVFVTRQYGGALPATPESVASGRLFCFSLAPCALPLRAAARILVFVLWFVAIDALPHSPRYVGGRPSGPHSQLSPASLTPALDSGFFLVASHNLASPRALAPGDHHAPGFRAGIDLGATWPRRTARPRIRGFRPTFLPPSLSTRAPAARCCTYLGLRALISCH
jgi:hypothetical protein